MRGKGVYQFFKCFLLFFVLTTVVYAKTNTLVGLKVLPLPNNKLRVEFEFKDNLAKKPSDFLMKSPATLIYDFVDMQSGLPEADTHKSVNLGIMKKYDIVSSGSRVRAVLSLQNTVAYKSQLNGNKFSITLASNVNKRVFQAKPRYLSHQLDNGRNRISDIDFRGAGKNSGKLIVKMSKSNTNIDISQSGDNIIVKFLDSGIDDKYLRQLDVSDFHTPARAIDVYQQAKTTKIVMKTKGNFGQFSYQVNDKFYVEVFPLTKEEIAKQKLKKKVYSGKQISLNFQNINIRSVLQLLAEFTGKNMVVSDAVKGGITLRLNEVPWDQALSIILKTKGLAERRMGDVILIAPINEIAEREQQEMKALAQSKELAPLLSKLMHINYAKAADIAEIVKSENTKLLSARGSVTVDTRTNALWIQDTAKQLDEIKSLILKLDVPVKQVLIEARVVNVNKDFEDDIGIRFGVSNSNHLSGSLEGANQVAGGTAPADVPIADRLNFDAIAPVTAGTPASIGIALAKLGQGTLLDLELSALETEGRGEVISSPRLITGNQQAAMIEAGEEIPYQEATSSGATSVAFKKAVLSLKVTPQITPDNRIILDLVVNQDTASAQRFNGVPAILTKQIETNVLVNNGQTLVLGGIYKQDKTSAVVRIPFLGKIPVLGMLFRNKRNIIKHEELLIFITPKIIRHSFMTNN